MNAKSFSSGNVAKRIQLTIKKFLVNIFLILFMASLYFIITRGEIYPINYNIFISILLMSFIFYYISKTVYHFDFLFID